MANEFARRLRKNMTPQEVKLWLYLRGLRKQGHHFRRQAPFRSYVLDFVSFADKVVIELYGSQHGRAEQAAADRQRDAVLREHGLVVLRFWNNQISDEMEGVWSVISDALRQAAHKPRDSA